MSDELISIDSISNLLEDKHIRIMKQIGDPDFLQSDLDSIKDEFDNKIKPYLSNLNRLATTNIAKNWVDLFLDMKKGKSVKSCQESTPQKNNPQKNNPQTRTKEKTSSPPKNKHGF